MISGITYNLLVCFAIFASALFASIAIFRSKAEKDEKNQKVFAFFWLVLALFWGINTLELFLRDFDYIGKIKIFNFASAILIAFQSALLIYFLFTSILKNKTASKALLVISIMIAASYLFIYFSQGITGGEIGAWQIEWKNSWLTNNFFLFAIAAPSLFATTYIFMTEFAKKIRNDINFRQSLFISTIAVLIYIIIGTIDMVGRFNDKALIMSRISLLAAVFLAYLAYSYFLKSTVSSDFKLEEKKEN